MKEKKDITPSLAINILQNLNDGVMITDHNGVIQQVNKAFCSITGYSEEEVIGQTPRILQSTLHDYTFYQKMWEEIVENGIWKGEVWNRHKNGKLYLQKLYIIEVKSDQGENVQYVGVSSDISEEEQIRKDIIKTGELQKSLLPKPFKNKEIEIDTIYQPSHYLSGDFYEYHWDEERKMLFGFLIDIMGHGITAAFQLSILRVLFNQKFHQQLSLKNILDSVNKESMHYFSEETFAAAICFQVDVTEQTLTYASAGINKFIKIHSNEKAAIIRQQGSYLGIFESASFEEDTLPFQKDETIFFLTDGLIDHLEEKNYQELSANFQQSMEQMRRIETADMKDDLSLIGIHLR